MICVLGATGRLGRMLHRRWGGAGFALPGPVLWQARYPAGPGWLRWDPLAEPWPGGVDLRGGVLFNLAGVTGGDAQALAANVDLGLAGCEAARAAGARHVFLCSSAAVYGRGKPDGGALSEDDLPAPANAYGEAKLRLEAAARDWAAQPGHPGVTLLRIGNVVGADALIGGARPGCPVRLDPVPGQAAGPERSYIGPDGLARVLAGLAGLAARGADLPFVLNLAAPGAVGMAALLDAARLPWHWGPENPAVLPRVALDTTRLEALLPGAAGDGSAGVMVAEWREQEGAEQ